MLAQYAVGQIEDLPAPIDIPPPNVKITEHAATILYLSSSLRPSTEAPSKSSSVVLLDLLSANTPGSTSVDPLFAFSYVIPRDDVHVSLSSHDDESGSLAASCGLPSSYPSTSYCDDDIMEATSTPEFIFPTHKWDDIIHTLGDLCSLSSSYASSSSHTFPHRRHVGSRHPTRITPFCRVYFISTMRSSCQHCSLSSHLLSCGTFQRDPPVNTIYRFCRWCKSLLPEFSLGRPFLPICMRLFFRTVYAFVLLPIIRLNMMMYEVY